MTHNGDGQMQTHGVTEREKEKRERERKDGKGRERARERGKEATQLDSSRLWTGGE